jgi:hypothetical protein
VGELYLESGGGGERVQRLDPYADTHHLLRQKPEHLPLVMPDFVPMTELAIRAIAFALEVEFMAWWWVERAKELARISKSAMWGKVSCLRSADQERAQERPTGKANRSPRYDDEVGGSAGGFAFCISEGNIDKRVATV